MAEVEYVVMQRYMQGNNPNGHTRRAEVVVGEDAVAALQQQWRAEIRAAGGDWRDDWVTADHA